MKRRALSQCGYTWFLYRSCRTVSSWAATAGCAVTHVCIAAPCPLVPSIVGFWASWCCLITPRQAWRPMSLTPQLRTVVSTCSMMTLRVSPCRTSLSCPGTTWCAVLAHLHSQGITLSTFCRRQTSPTYCIRSTTVPNRCLLFIRCLPHE